jgi:hypothetical protein
VSQLISDAHSNKMLALFSSICSSRSTDSDDGKVQLVVPMAEEKQRWQDQAHLADRSREASPLSLTEDLTRSKHREVENEEELGMDKWRWLRFGQEERHRRAQRGRGTLRARLNWD